DHPALGRTRGQNPARRQPSRHSDRATHAIPTRAQRQEGQGSRPDHSGKALHAGRRGDRKLAFIAILLQPLTAASGTTRTFRNVRAMSVIEGISDVKYSLQKLHSL